MSTGTTATPTTPGRARGPYWHVYGKEMDGIYATVIAGPAPMGPDDLNGKGLIVRDAMPDWDYLGTFVGQEPTDFEKDQLQPEEFRQFDSQGNEIPWDDEDPAPPKKEN